MLVEKLQTGEVEIIRNALRPLNRLIRVPLNAVKAVKARILPELNILTSRPEVDVRRSAVLSLQLLSQNSTAKPAMCAPEANLLYSLQKVITDEDTAVRRGAMDVALNLAMNAECLEAMTGAGWVPCLVRRCQEEKDATALATALDTLRRVVNTHGSEGQKQAIESDAADVCTALLKHDADGVVRGSAGVLQQMAIDGGGKVRCIDAGCVPPLLAVCKGRKEDGAVAAACGALMYLGIDDRGKHAIVDAGGVTPLVELCRHHDPLVVLNAVRAVGSAAAHPVGRVKANAGGAVEILEQLCEGEGPCFGPSMSDVLRRVIQAASATKSVVEWTP
jgi:hypothetical protein